MQPAWFAAEGFAEGGRAEAHTSIAQSVAQKTAEEGQHVWCFRVDLADALGTISNPASCARGLVQLARWRGGKAYLAAPSHVIGVCGDGAPIHKVCKQGGPETSWLWSLFLDEVVAAVLQRWQDEGLCELSLARRHKAQAKDLGRCGTEV